MLETCACDVDMQMHGGLVRTKIRDHRRRTVVSFDRGGDVSDHSQQFGSALHQWPSGLSVRRCGAWALRRCGQTCSAIAMLDAQLGSKRVSGCRSTAYVIRSR